MYVFLCSYLLLYRVFREKAREVKVASNVCMSIDMYCRYDDMP